MNHSTYTQKEIEHKISKIENDISDLETQRKELNRVIREKRKQKEYWESLDKGQYKLYE